MEVILLFGFPGDMMLLDTDVSYHTYVHSNFRLIKLPCVLVVVRVPNISHFCCTLYSYHVRS